MRRDEKTLEYIKALDKFGMIPGLKRIERLLEELSHPELCMDFVHVGGTNGKGSVSVMIESVLREGGFKTGLFTSPHLERYTERIKVCGVEIPEEAVEEITNNLKEVASAMAADPDMGHPTEFEICTAICLEWFKRQQVEIAVMEVGLGGLLDSTNVITPKVSVITNVGMDHIDVLGENIEEITCQKAGIIKPGVPVITSSQLPEVYEILKNIAAEKNSDIYQVGRDVTLEIQKMSLGGSEITLRINPEGKLTRDEEDADLLDVDIKLAGEYQGENAACAFGAISILRTCTEYEKIRDEDIVKGLSKARHPGRFEVVSEDPLIILDGAHNLDGAKALFKSLEGLLPNEKVVMLLSLSKDKPASEILEVLKDKIEHLIVTKSNYTRIGSFDVNELESLAKKENISVEKEDELEEAFERAKACSSGKTLVICGSLYLIGEIKSILSREIETNVEDIQ